MALAWLRVMRQKVEGPESSNGRISSHNIGLSPSATVTVTVTVLSLALPLPLPLPLSQP